MADIHGVTPAASARAIALETPMTAFRDLATAEAHSVFGVYLVQADDHRVLVKYSKLSGAIAARTESGDALLSTGTTAFGYAALQSRRRIPYLPGVAMRFLWTAAHGTPVANSLQLSGPLHVEDGFAFGYNGTQFGIMHRHGRKVAIHKIVISVGSTVAANATITLNGSANTVALPGSSSVWADADAILAATLTDSSGYAGWDAFSVDPDDGSGEAHVYLYRQFHGAVSAPSISAGTTGATLAISETRAGADGAQDWVYQNDWNIDKLDGNGPSRATVTDWSSLRIYGLELGWLGAHGPVLYVQIPNRKDQLVPVHYIKWGGVTGKTVPTVVDPRFTLLWAVASEGSTTNVEMAGASGSGQVYGDTDKIVRTRWAYVSEAVTVTDTETPVMAIMSAGVNETGTAVNRRRVQVVQVTAAYDQGTRAITLKVYKAARTALTGAQWQRHHAGCPVLHSNSTMTFDNSAADLLDVVPVAVGSTNNMDFYYWLEPGEALVITSDRPAGGSTHTVTVVAHGDEDP